MKHQIDVVNRMLATEGSEVEEMDVDDEMDEDVDEEVDEDGKPKKAGKGKGKGKKGKGKKGKGKGKGKGKRKCKGKGKKKKCKGGDDASAPAAAPAGAPGAPGGPGAPGAPEAPTTTTPSPIDAALLSAKAANEAAIAATDAANAARNAAVKIREATEDSVDYSSVGGLVYEAAYTTRITLDKAYHLAHKSTPPFIYTQTKRGAVTKSDVNETIPS